MHAIEQKILQNFAGNPDKEISTTELVKKVFSEEYDEIKRYVHNEQKDKELVKAGRRKKARLHRKLLYHLNKLSDEEILKVTKVEGKGEKYFVMSINANSGNGNFSEAKKIVESYYDVNSVSLSMTGIESYEEEGIVKRFDSKNWLSKINAMIIESSQVQDIKKMYEFINELYPVYNDVLAINDFQVLVEKEPLEELTNFIRKANLDTKDYNKYINIILDLTSIKNAVKISDFSRAYAEINPDKIFIIYKTNSKHLNNQNRLMTQVIKNFDENKIRINIQNSDLHSAPYMIGRAGTYTFDDYEWEVYRKNIKGKTTGLCAAETSMYIDLERLFKKHKNFSELRSLILKSAKALLLSTSFQRKKSDLNFKKINDMNAPNQNLFFAFSYNYIRLWNYSVYDEDGSDFSVFVDFLKGCMDEINEFCKSEETIFKACGLPIRFRVTLSSAFRRFDKDFMTPRKYKKMNVKGLADYQKEEMIKDIQRREALLKIFNGRDRVRFFRAHNFSPEEIISEFHLILNTFKLPLFTYDFRTMKGEVTLNNFI